MAKTFTLLVALLAVFAIGATSDETSNPTTPDATSAATDISTTPTPASSSTTASPPTTSTGSPATTVSGATQPPSTATVPPSTQVPATTETPDACVSSPCGSGSTCEPRANQTFVCLCLPGESYNKDTKICQRAKAFPGQLTLTNTKFDEKMTDNKSEIFLTTSEDIITEIDNTFKNVLEAGQYSYCLVLELRKSPGKKASSESGDKVEASIDIFFTANAEVTKQLVQDTIKKAAECEKCVLGGSSFVPKPLCDSKACDTNTTKCAEVDGSFSCSCQEDYIPTKYSDKVCLACPSGQKAKDSKCVPCSFGYTGLNCSDNRLLAVVIAASVLGGLLLIALIVMPVVAVKMKKKGSKKNAYEDIGKPYMSHSVAKTPAVNNDLSSSFKGPANGVATPAGVPRIPRATGGSNWDNKTNLEMVPSNSRQNLISSGRNTQWMNDDEDDTFKFGQSRPQTSYYEQIRPQQNAYAQSPSVNPYAQRQGNSNPYFMSDDSRYSR